MVGLCQRHNSATSPPHEDEPLGTEKERTNTKPKRRGANVKCTHITEEKFLQFSNPAREVTAG